MHFLKKISLQEQGQVLPVNSSKHKTVERKSESQEGVEETREEEIWFQESQYSTEN